MRTAANEGHKQNAYRFTVRQLESLIRLSEAMARLHCDDKIRPQYVKEVCRLLKTSNINIVKNDIEFEENQQALNDVGAIRKVEVAENKVNGGFVNDLFVSSRLNNIFSNMRRKNTLLSKLWTRPSPPLSRRRQRKSRLPTMSTRESLS